MTCFENLEKLYRTKNSKNKAKKPVNPEFHPEENHVSFTFLKRFMLHDFWYISETFSLKSEKLDETSRNNDLFRKL
jgi:hypothetical protein